MPTSRSTAGGATARSPAASPPRRPRTPRSEITELGDARVFGAGREIDARGKVLLAPFTVGARGWGARRWLDAAALERLGRLGVARVVWAVAPRHVGPALQHARALAGPGRPRVEVTDEENALPRRVLARAPVAPADGTLAERIAAIDAACSHRGGDALPAALAALWASRGPLLRFEGPASFTLLAPAASGDDLGAAAVETTFLDGVELAGGGR